MHCIGRSLRLSAFLAYHLCLRLLIGRWSFEFARPFFLRLVGRRNGARRRRKASHRRPGGLASHAASNSNGGNLLRSRYNVHSSVSGFIVHYAWFDTIQHLEVVDGRATQKKTHIHPRSKIRPLEEFAARDHRGFVFAYRSCLRLLSRRCSFDFARRLCLGIPARR